MYKLIRNYYACDTVQAAQALLGKVLARSTPEGPMLGRIVETEAYVQGDPASHSTRGMTPRNRVLFGEPGYAYVYLIYGMHYCLNLVSHPPGIPGGTMIRALEPLQGIDIMRRNRGCNDIYNLCKGPGKLTKALQIDISFNGEDLLGERLYVLDDGIDVGEIIARPRIGIKVGTDKPWRFYPARYREWVSKV